MCRAVALTATVIRHACGARLSDAGQVPLCCSCPVTVGFNDQRKLCEQMCVDGVSTCEHGEAMHCVSVPCDVTKTPAVSTTQVAHADDYFKDSEVCLFENSPAEAYFWDPSCASGGVGCNADGRSQSCRFCGHHRYAVPCPTQESSAMPEDHSLPCYGLIHPSVCFMSDGCYWDRMNQVCNARCEAPGNQYERLCNNGGAGPCVWADGRCASSLVSCVSYMDWRSSADNSCEDYRNNRWCNPDGTYGSQWSKMWGSWSRYAGTNGTSAGEACCACGGGQEVERLEQGALDE